MLFLSSLAKRPPSSLSNRLGIKVREERASFSTTMLGSMAMVCSFAMTWAGLASPVKAFQASDLSSDEALKFFEAEVRPILVASCLECHSEASSEGELRLDSQEGLLTGGEQGPAVVAFDPASSLLIAAIEQQGGLEMPPDEKLSDSKILVLRRWIELGAPWPQGTQLQQQRRSESLTEADRNHWAFRPITSPPVPMVADADWGKNEIDLFVRAAQELQEVTPAPEADRVSLARRVAFDLTGLPPDPTLLEAFLADSSDSAYATYVDQLLSSTAFGERWADAWFDWVRFGESDGYKADAFRPTAWRYRDYVIRSLNDDRPFDQFIVEQLAGDLLEPTSPDSIAATGYLRLWIYEYNQRDARTQWTTILDDLTETTADAFLGLGIGCAKCHDHKYDPLFQEDYYRLQACFVGFSANDQVPLATEAEREAFLQAERAWQDQHAELRSAIDELEKEARHQATRSAIEKFPPDIVALYDLPAEQRTSLDQQLIELANRQVDEEISKLDFAKRLSEPQLSEWQALKAEWEAALKERPQGHPTTLGVSEIENAIQHWPVAGDRSRTVSPGAPRVLVPVDQPPEFADPAKRRLALANWIVSRQNPLTSRVMVNRVWQQMMGRGLVDSPSDFGLLTEAPVLPELLDYLAERWQSQGWKLKSLIREIALSATYQQSHYHPAEAEMLAIDPERSLVWRAERRRLDAGQLRDLMLWASGELSARGEGPSSPHDAMCRSVYLKVLRNQREPLLDAFDFPDRIRSQACRNVTTSPLQALLLMNHRWVLGRANAFAERVRSAAGEQDVAAIEKAFSLAFTRRPQPNEIAASLDFLQARLEESVEAGNDRDAARRDAWIDFCHGLMNSNEFLHLD